VHSQTEKSLTQLIHNLEVEQVAGNIDITINGLSNDSRQIQPGNLFIAIKGYKYDGHSFINDALKKGAKAVISEHPFPNSSVPIIQVKNSRYAQAILAAKFFNHPSSQLKVVGITGTNGKSTSTFMINHILETTGFRTGLLGTVHYKIDKATYPSLHTTPDSIKLQSFLAEMVNEQVSHAILEVSSHGIALDRIVDLQFLVGGITNITFDHLELHPSMQDYINTKGKFFTILPPGGAAIFNGDDPVSLRLISQTSAQSIIYGLDSNLSTVKATNIRLNSDYTKFDVVIKKPFFTTSGQKIKPGSFSVSLQCAGSHNIYNALLAITTCLTLDLSSQEIQKGMSSFQGVPRRLEVIYNQDFKVINDVAHNPGSFQAVFAAIQKEKFHNLHIVNSIRGSRGIKINQANTQVIIDWAKKLKPKNIFLTSASDTCRPLDIVQEEELQVVLKTFQESGVKIEYSDELKTSVENACAAVKEKDLLVFLGAHSMDTVVEIFHKARQKQ